MSDDATDDVDVRHRFTNDGLAYVLVVSNVLLLAVALAFGVTVPGPLWQTFALAVALLGAAVALDDAASHAFGVWTPLDAGWTQVYHLLP